MPELHAAPGSHICHLSLVLCMHLSDGHAFPGMCMMMEISAGWYLTWMTKAIGLLQLLTPGEDTCLVDGWMNV